ncbi:MAG: selenocysteine-specific translation elongation factor [Syntrophobacterales bacterium]|nr:MAG: selenocysteine-specific translation elongation factor [Syntrophobacterales bacterium]
MKQIVLGTAGHIDHGKTALIKALTGIDTDRLKEEKERGITIELGFASLMLPSGLRMGIVDVPGHEKFVKHMVAGAWGIDLVALVVAADEGIMPQTREHLDICRLLAIKKGLVVVSKIDLADPELVQLVDEEVRELVKGTFLDGAPIVNVSSLNAVGITQLVTTLDRLANEVQGRTSEGLFRLPIDRVFTMKGFGTVVTGTLVSGSISVGDTVQILPSSREGKVRGIQVHNEIVEMARAGQRTAVNLQGIEKSRINRGDVLVRPQAITPTYMVDAYLEHLTTSPRPVRNRKKQRFHIGTSSILATIVLLDREELAPGEEGFVQLRFEKPMVALPQDRFVIRGSSAIQTLGGGVVIDSHPAKHKRLAKDVVAGLMILRDGTEEEIVSHHLVHSGGKGMSLRELRERVNVSPDRLSKLLRELLTRAEIVTIDGDEGRFIHRTEYEQLKKKILSYILEFHESYPLRLGPSKEEVKSKLPKNVEAKLFHYMLKELVDSKEVLVEKDKLRLSTHRVSLRDDQKRLKNRIAGLFAKGGLQSPSLKELASKLSADDSEVRNVVRLLMEEGAIIKAKEDMYFHREAVEKLKGQLIQFLRIHHEITTAQFKEMTKVSRKYAIPLIEYFDNSKITIRVGEKRLLRGE